MEITNKIYYPLFREEEFIINRLTEKEYQLINMETGKNYCLGENEVKLLKLCDGNQSMEEIIEKNHLEISEKAFCRFVLTGIKIGILESDQKKKKEKIDITALKLPLIRLSKTVICKKPVAATLKYILYALCIISMIYIGYVVKTDLPTLVSVVMTTNYLRFHNILFYFLNFFILAFFHENAHAIVLASYGVLPGRMGVMLSHFHPSCYIEVTGVNKIKSKAGRIQVWLAGVVAQICLFAVSLYTILNVSLEGTWYDFVLVSSMVNFALIIFNLFYVIKLDGYHILCELLEDNALREGAIGFVMNRFRVTEGQRQSSLVYTVVGLVCLIYIPIFVVSIITNVAEIFVENVGKYLDIAMSVGLSTGLIILLIRTILRKRKGKLE